MIRLLGLAAAVALAPLPALALESAAVTTPHARVTLVSAVEGIAPGASARLGLRFQLAPGWHIYWANPGDAGEPPTVAWTLSAGAKASDLVWPAPVRIAEGTLATYAYTGDVLLPLTMTAPGPLSVGAKARWLVCEKICIPESGDLHLDLPSGPPRPSPEAPLFAAADARTPTPSPYPASVASDGTLSLSGAGLAAETVREARFFPATPDTIDNGAAQDLTAGDGRLSLKLAPGRAFDPHAALSGILVVDRKDGAQENWTVAAAPLAGVAPPAAPAASPAPEPALAEATPPLLPAAQAVEPIAALPMAALAQTLALAFLAGLILNLMPCVFPVLAIKALGLARLSGSQRTAVRWHALSYTAGVLAAFAALAAVLLTLRDLGQAAGWGFQFQSPAFVAATAWLLFLVGLNFSGLFTLSGGFVGAGQGLTQRGGHAGSFFTGLLAVLVATPCTAPFMGGAVAAALAAPPAETLAVFGAMGLGLAAPYAVLALAPGLSRLLPRPGRWMETLKQVLAFPMYAAAAWLVWVVSLQAGADGLLATLAGLVLLGFAAWTLTVVRGSGRAGSLVWRGAGGLAAVAAVAVLYGLGSASALAPSRAAEISDDQVFSPARLAALRAEGRPVLVNMTAAWCFTCLVNERVALSSDRIRKSLADHNVAYLKGDWTRADPEIGRFLKSYGRDGVPLYVFFDPRAAPVVLPQILTEGTVLDQIDRLGG